MSSSSTLGQYSDVFTKSLEQGRANLERGSEYWREQQAFHKLSGNRRAMETAEEWAFACEKLEND